jgi:hypothetical protein
VVHVGGGRYTARSQSQLSVVARNTAVAATVCGWRGLVLSELAVWLTADGADAAAVRSCLRGARLSLSSRALSEVPVCCCLRLSHGCSWTAMDNGARTGVYAVVCQYVLG